MESHELRWFSFFLHHYENRLNGRVRRFLLWEGLDRYDPERFLDYKMGCVLAMLDCLQRYDPTQGADFPTYGHHFIGSALLTYRMQEEASEESGEDVSRYDHWDYAEILWNGIQAEAVREAFEKLNYREQTLLEKRNAICMTCGRVSHINTRLTFE